MIHALKFVQGAVAKKDFAPALTHFRIHNGFVKGFNGRMAICSPINVDLDIAPKALQFVKAINACTDTIALHVEKNGKLVVRSGSFKAHVECADKATYPDVVPSGRMVNVNESLLPALRYLEPFIADDASRPWACGILLNGECAYATNNIVVMQYWTGFPFPERVNIPADAVREIIRIGENPVRLQVEEGRIVFHYSDGRWLASQLYEDKWPDVDTLLDKNNSKDFAAVGGEFWAALEQILPFCDELGRCHLLGDRMATAATPELAGASVTIKCPASGIFNARQLAKLKEVASHIAFDAYPAPVPFVGDRARGVIAGIRPQ